MYFFSSIVSSIVSEKLKLKIFVCIEFFLAKMSSGENTASNGAGLQKSILSAIKNTTSLQVNYIKGGIYFIDFKDSRESSFEKSKTLTLSSNPKSKFLEEVINPNPESKKLSVITESTNSFVSDLKKGLFKLY